jgi:uncharacterized protein
MKTILRSAKEYAYKAVNNPVEGTILSVVRALDEKYDREATSLTEAFASILELAQTATDHTPEQLPVLKEAGVVDSGAYGLVLLIKGALSALNGDVLRLDEVSKSENSTSAFVKADPTANIGYRVYLNFKRT